MRPDYLANNGLSKSKFTPEDANFKEAFGGCWKSVSCTETTSGTFRDSPLTTRNKVDQEIKMKTYKRTDTKCAVDGCSEEIRSTASSHSEKLLPLDAIPYREKTFYNSTNL